MIGVSFVSVNTRGLRSETKRLKVFSTLKDRVNCGVFLMQETHSCVADEEKWQKEWGAKLQLNHGSTNSRGTMIGFSKNLDIKNFTCNQDHEGRIQVVSFQLEEKNFLIANIYNNNIQSEQIETLKKLSDMLENSNPFEKEVIIGGDFNFIFDKKLDAHGGTPELKLLSIAELTKIINKFDLCDIYRVRNPQKKLFSYKKPNHRLLRRLDFFLCSNSLRDNIINTDILTAIDSDHSPVVLKVGDVDDDTRGPSYWKFPSTLVKDLQYVNELKLLILNAINEINGASSQSTWEYVKFRIREFTIEYSKKMAKIKKQRKSELEKIIFKYENTTEETPRENYEAAREEYNQMTNEFTYGQILRTKTLNYQSSEKHSKYFLNLEKKGPKTLQLSVYVWNLVMK